MFNNNFLKSERLLRKCLPLFINVFFYLFSPLFPRPQTTRTPATKPSTQEARAMAVGTVLFDYILVGVLFVYWDHVLSGRCICPVSAACAPFAMAFIFPLKDDIQARLIWTNFISRAKLNSWAYTWELSLQHLFCHMPYHFATFFSLTCAGFVEFPSIGNFAVMQRVWIETMLMLLMVDVFMSINHKWMHKKSTYFLHKDHHKGLRNISIGFGLHMSLVDHFFEVGIGIPMLLFCKAVLGHEKKIHFLSIMLWFISGFQIHSMNPYAPFSFNPVLDYFLRPTVTHNLHHALQVGYYSAVTKSHLFSLSGKRSDIDLYNKHMGTHFPCWV